MSFLKKKSIFKKIADGAFYLPTRDISCCSDITSYEKICPFSLFFLTGLCYFRLLQHGVSTDYLGALNEELLHECGVSNPIHRMKLMDAIRGRYIAQINIYSENTVPEGLLAYFDT